MLGRWATSTKKGLKEGQRWRRKEKNESVHFHFQLQCDKKCGNIGSRSRVQQRIYMRDSGLHPVTGLAKNFPDGLNKVTRDDRDKKIMSTKQNKK